MKYILVIFVFLMITNQRLNSQELWERSQIFSDYQTYPIISQIKYLGNGECRATGYLGGSYLNLLRSADYGKSWDSYYDYYWDIDDTVPPPNPFAMQSSFILNSNAIYGLFKQDAAIIRYYSDPKKQDTFWLGKNEVATGIYMKNENYGVFTDEYFVKITKDGWNTVDTEIPGGQIKTINILQNGNIVCGVYLNDSTFFVISPDSNYKWSHYFIDKGYIPLYQSFINDTIGWIMSQKPSGVGDRRFTAIHKTTDGGKTWRKQLDTTNIGFFGVKDIKFKNDKIGVAATAPNIIFETKDGGETWKTTRFNSPSGTNGQHVFRIDFTEDMILLGTDYESIWRRPIFPKTDVEQFEQISLVFPNPFKESFTIRDTKIPKGTYNLKVTSQEGIIKIDKTIEYNGFYQIHNDLSTGMYIWQLQGNSNFYGKIIKE